MKSIIVFFLFLLSFEAAFAQDRGRPSESADFIGAWHNVEVRKTQVVRIVIRPERHDEGIFVEIFGFYRGQPICFGTFSGRVFASRRYGDRDEDDSAVLVPVRKPWVNGDVLLRFNKRGEIVSHALLRFEDERGDVYNVERFAPAERDGYRSERRRRPDWR